MGWERDKLNAVVEREVAEVRSRFPAPGSWRLEPSVVTAVKRAYREGSKSQRAGLRAWMRRVLSGEDGK